MRKRRILGLLLLIVACFVIGNKVVSAKDPFYNITSIFFRTNAASPGERLYVDLYMLRADSSTTVTGEFVGEEGSYNMALPLEGVLTRDPYFNLPADMKPGTEYVMTRLTVTDSEGSITYSLIGPNEGLPFMNPGDRNIVIMRTDFVITEFSVLGEQPFKSTDKIRFKIRVNKPVDYICICARNREDFKDFIMDYVQKKDDDIYELDLTRNTESAHDGKYYISDVFLSSYEDLSSPTGAHFTSYYVTNGVDYLDQYVEFEIKNPEPVVEEKPKKDILKGISLSKETVKLNEKVYVSLNTTEKIKSASLTFIKDKERLTVDLKDINKEPYFLVPFTTKDGKYELDYVVLKDKDGKEYKYRRGAESNGIRHFDFNVAFTVENKVESGNVLTLENDKITVAIIEKIKELAKDITIELNADNNPMISKEIFEVLKGTKRDLKIKYKNTEWIFKGSDIKRIKSIDVNSKIYDIDTEEEISSKVNKGFIMDFADNEDLPGKCIIRLYDNETLAKIFKKGSINVYYYDEKEKTFELIKADVKYNAKGYYDFSIKHNSKYIITPLKIDSKYVSNVKNETVVSKGSNKKIIVIIVLGILALASAITATILIVKNKKGKKKKEIEAV